MRRGRFTLILCFMTLLSFIGVVQCSEKVTEPKLESPSNAFPMTIGSWWEYEVTQMTTWWWKPEDTSLMVDTVRATVMDTIRTDSTGVLLAVVVYEPRFPTLGGGNNTMYFDFEDADSLSAVDTLSIYGSPSGQFLFWGFLLDLNLDTLSQSDGRYSVVLKDTTIHVPAGEFDACLHFYQHQSGHHGFGIIRNDWLNEGVGIVRSYVLENESPGSIYGWLIEHTWTLLEYHIEGQ